MSHSRPSKSDDPLAVRRRKWKGNILFKCSIGHQRIILSCHMDCVKKKEFIEEDEAQQEEKEKV